MLYEVKTIEAKEDIDSCMPFSVSHFQWDSVISPKTYGRLAFIPGEGLFVSLTCEETNPKRDCREYQKNVCQDSVMEAFFAFPEEGKSPENDDMYLNFEMNPNAMLYAKYGKGRKNRTFISDELYEKSGCTVKIKEDSWTASVLIPRELLEQIGVWEDIKNGGTFYCNFYKTSDYPDIRHYGSCHPIKSEIPNFHLPVYFGAAQVV